jgi:hypothetical protein
MLVLFSKKKNMYVTVEQIWINDPKFPRKILYEAVRANMENVYLHPDYIPDDKLLYSLDRKKNKITYFSCKYSGHISFP